ncbi:MAG: hypothetical protein MI923_20130 [Phycisphaerales bacterium]|nr:hypothetical protein [Phycisphaerales bacterium]
MKNRKGKFLVRSIQALAEAGGPRLGHRIDRTFQIILRVDFIEKTIDFFAALIPFPQKGAGHDLGVQVTQSGVDPEYRET